MNIIKPSDVMNNRGIDFNDRVTACAEEINIKLNTNDAAYDLKAKKPVVINIDSLREKNSSIVNAAVCLFYESWWVSSTGSSLFFYDLAEKNK